MQGGVRSDKSWLGRKALEERRTATPSVLRVCLRFRVTPTLFQEQGEDERKAKVHRVQALKLSG